MSVHIYIDETDVWPAYEATKTSNRNGGYGVAVLTDEEWERYLTFSKEAQYWHSKLAELYNQSKRSD